MVRRTRGFTLIELLIVIVIMGILLTLGVVNLSSTQVTARDSQRSGNVQAIQAALEAFWQQGGNGIPANNYPSTAMASNPTTYLTDLNSNALLAPNTTSNSLVAATNATQTATGVSPQPTTTTFVYQPIAGDGTLCTSDTQAWSGGNGSGCTSYNLYYYSETNSAPVMVTSRHHQ